MTQADPIAALSRIHEDVDRRASKLTERYAGLLQCRLGCVDCCIDGLTVFDIEAELIRRRQAELLRSESPHPEGTCAFLDAAGACRVYAERPYVCRTQGLPLRWIEGATEYRDICPRNELAAPIESLGEEGCWLIGPYEGRLATLQAGLGAGRPHRVALRDLFR